MFTAILLLLVVILAGAIVSILAMKQDKTQQHKQELGALEAQIKQQQEQHRSLISQWEDRFRKARERFGKVMDLDDEANKVRWEIKSLQGQLQLEQQQVAAQSAQIRVDYQVLSDSYRIEYAKYELLKREISLLEENLEDISYGLYKPHFAFDSSEDFRSELEATRGKKKEMVRNNQATQCLVQWSVGGSQTEGARMQKQLTKLMLRAFNGETDAAIGNCSWNNMTRMEERIQRAFTAINQLGTTIQVSITPEYHKLALDELRLEFEYQEKRRAEAEEQREIRERMREEERVQREAERVEAETAAEEARTERALAKAREEVKSATGAKLADMLQRIRELESDLSAAHARHERAVSMAELTRCGYVYIISNIGSFGDNMFKLGLTRRLEPLDRIKELGDASVPFPFDVHAMVYCDDAPALECALHQRFRDRSVNLVNSRKEFFHVTLDEIEQFIMERGLHIKLTKLAEAREYRESLAMRAKAATGRKEKGDLFPPVMPACAVA